MKAAKMGALALRLLFAGAAVASFSLEALSATEPVDWGLAFNTTPFRPTTEDTIRILLTVDTVANCTVLDFTEPPQVDGFRIRLQGRRGSPSTTCLGGRQEYEILLPPLTVPGAYQLEIMDEELLLLSQQLDVRGPWKTLNFPEWLVVTLRLTDPRVGAPRDVSAVQLTEEAGYFWFFTPENIEVTVKLLDGRPVNGHYWIFLSGMTDLGLTVTVTQSGNCPLAACLTKTYTNPPGKRLNIIDTNLF